MRLCNKSVDEAFCCNLPFGHSGACADTLPMSETFTCGECAALRSHLAQALKERDEEREETQGRVGDLMLQVETLTKERDEARATNSLAVEYLLELAKVRIDRDRLAAVVERVREWAIHEMDKTGDPEGDPYGDPYYDNTYACEHILELLDTKK